MDQSNSIRVDEISAESAVGVVQDDPTRALAAGQRMRITVDGMLLRLDQGRPEGQFPMKHLFHGALLAMTFRDKNGDHTAGSAVLIAPGIALCASHVLADFEKAFPTGECRLMCGGPADHGVNLWLVQGGLQIPESDLSVLWMTLASAMPPENRFIVPHLTTRTPAVGECVAMYGLPARERTIVESSGNVSIPVSARYTSGRVMEIHHAGRDRVMLPGPCFAVECDAFGGMSGGPVFDSRGYLIGIVSSSYSGEAPVAFVSAIWPALTPQIFPVWPAPSPFPSGSLLELQSRTGLVNIEGSEAVSAVPGERFRSSYVPWS